MSFTDNKKIQDAAIKAGGSYRASDGCFMFDGIPTLKTLDIFCSELEKEGILKTESRGLSAASTG